MIDTEIRDIVTGWHSRAQLEDDDISRFVFLWFCISAWLAYESGKDIDRNMIEWLIDRHTTPPQLRVAFDKAMLSDSFPSHVQALVVQSPITGTGRRHRPPARAESRDDFAGVVECLYRIRCNLFHGGKSVANPRDQQLVQSSAQILDGWVSHLIALWM
jgi:hypothetical protein